MRFGRLHEQLLPKKTLKTGSVNSLMDVCGYGELQVLHRKGIPMGKLQSENASIDKTAICQQASKQNRRGATY